MGSGKGSAEQCPAHRLVSAALGSLDEEVGGAEMARRACYSVPQFHRLFAALIRERPGELRRRLLLERAAFQLGRSALSVTEIAFEAQFGSLEAFTRAFRRAFGVSPSLYRRSGTAHYHLPAPNGLHFYVTGPRQKVGGDVDLFDRLAGADSWHTRRILERARELTDAQLDQLLENPPLLFPFCTPDASLRDLLDRIVATKEAWTAALTGGPIPASLAADAEGLPRTAGPDSGRTPVGMLARFEAVDGEFNRILREVRDAGRWDDTFVDALCEPPETFTFGGMFTHVITFNTHRRLLALAAMRRFGINDLGYGDPYEYERSMETAAV